MFIFQSPFIYDYVRECSKSIVDTRRNGLRYYYEPSLSKEICEKLPTLRPTTTFISLGYYYSRKDHTYTFILEREIRVARI